jgi:hypothetical protein
VPTKRKSLNLEIIASNLAEAIEELEGLRSQASDGTLSEGAFLVGLRHTYHHVNFAWNIRHVETRDYTRLTQKQFERWGKYPSRIDAL